MVYTQQLVRKSESSCRILLDFLTTISTMYVTAGIHNRLAARVKTADHSSTVGNTTSNSQHDPFRTCEELHYRFTESVLGIVRYARRNRARNLSEPNLILGGARDNILIFCRVVLCHHFLQGLKGLKHTCLDSKT